jgi:hypothetical protein
MWSNTSISSEGAYAISCELIHTLAQLYSYNSSASRNHVWCAALQTCLDHIFTGNNLSQYKASNSVELECVMALIPGGEYMGMLPYARATVMDQKSEEDSKKKKGHNKYAQVIGFVHKRWLSQRDLPWSREERRVFHTLSDSSQKVLAM